jgi:hypothetical protein
MLDCNACFCLCCSTGCLSGLVQRRCSTRIGSHIGLSLPLNKKGGYTHITTSIARLCTICNGPEKLAKKRWIMIARGRRGLNSAEQRINKLVRCGSDLHFGAFVVFDWCHHAHADDVLPAHDH